MATIDSYGICLSSDVTTDKCSIHQKLSVDEDSENF